MADNKRPIIIKKIKKGGHGHHGGAWKVAYADFVTAMMAFFLLLWLLNSVTSESLKGISEYFTPTIGIAGEKGIGFQGGTAPIVKGTAKSEAAGGGEGIIFGTDKTGPLIKLPEESEAQEEEIEAQKFTSIETQLENLTKEDSPLGKFKENIDITQTPEGLRIRIMDSDKNPMFKNGNVYLESYTKEVLASISNIIRYIPNFLSIEGSTTKTQEKNPNNYTGWELSMERANNVRKFLNEQKIAPEQIYRIIGKADSDPADKNNPDAPRNKRVDIILLKNKIVPHHKKSAPDSDTITLDKNEIQKLNSEVNEDKKDPQVE